MNEQFAFRLPVEASYDRADFLEAPCNQAALRMIDRWPDWPHPIIVLIGPAACGKTHLARLWQQKSSAAILNEHTPITNTNNLLADDLDRHFNLIGEEKLFALINQCLHSNLGEGRWLITASRLDWWRELCLPDLRSRLAAMPVVEIDAPDDMLISALLVKLFSDRQLKVPSSLVGWLLPRMERSFTEARRIVARLDEESAARRKPITISLAREVLF